MRSTARSDAPRWEWLVVLAALGTILCAIPALFAIPAERILFAPGVYKQVLAEQGFYQQYPAWLGEMTAPTLERVLPGSAEKMRGFLESSRFQQVLEDVFPPEWVQAESEALIDQFWAFFNFDTDQLRLVVDLRAVKENLTGPGSPQIVTTIVEGLPPCTGNDLLEFGLQALSGADVSVPLCRPPDQLVGLSNALVGGLLQQAASALPDEVDLSTALRFTAGMGGPAAQAAWQDWFGLYHIFRLALRWMPVLALLSLAATALLALMTYRGPFFWAGVAMLLSGFAGLIIALLVGVLASQAAPFIVRVLFGDFVVSSTLANLIGEVLRRFATTSAVAALVAFLVGTASAAGSLAWQSRPSRKTQR